MTASEQDCATCKGGKPSQASFSCAICFGPVIQWKADLLASRLPLGGGRRWREKDDLDWVDSRQRFEYGE